MELIFEVRDAEEGGYCARALGHSIFTEADAWESGLVTGNYSRGVDENGSGAKWDFRLKYCCAPTIVRVEQFSQGFLFEFEIRVAGNSSLASLAAPAATLEVGHF